MPHGNMLRLYKLEQACGFALHVLQLCLAPLYMLLKAVPHNALPHEEYIIFGMLLSKHIGRQAGKQAMQEHGRSEAHQ